MWEASSAKNKSSRYQKAVEQAIGESASVVTRIAAVVDSKIRAELHALRFPQRGCLDPPKPSSLTCVEKILAASNPPL